MVKWISSRSSITCSRADAAGRLCQGWRQQQFAGLIRRLIRSTGTTCLLSSALAAAAPHPRAHACTLPARRPDTVGAHPQPTAAHLLQLPRLRLQRLRCLDANGHGVIQHLLRPQQRSVRLLDLLPPKLHQLRRVHACKQTAGTHPEAKITTAARGAGKDAVHRSIPQQRRGCHDHNN